jgi:hypothetical protein
VMASSYSGSGALVLRAAVAELILENMAEREFMAMDGDGLV